MQWCLLIAKCIKKTCFSHWNELVLLVFPVFLANRLFVSHDLFVQNWLLSNGTSKTKPKLIGASYWCKFGLLDFTVAFNNVDSQFKAQLTNAVFTMVNQMFDSSSQLLTVLYELCSMIWLNYVHSAVLRSLIDCSKECINFVGRALNLKSPQVIEWRSKGNHYVCHHSLSLWLFVINEIILDLKGSLRRQGKINGIVNQTRIKSIERN